MKILAISLKTLRYLFIGILAVVLLLSTVHIVRRVVFKEQMPLVGGFGSAVVVSGSMEPTISVQDVIVTRRQDTYQVGDIVTFKSNSCITHRIVEKTVGGYITQGDANNTPDGAIDSNQVIGKVVRVVPQAGKVIFFLQTPLGMLMLMLGLCVTVEVPHLWETLRNNSYHARHSRPRKRPAYKHRVGTAR